MDVTYWQRQADKPLFPELEWSRPETKALAGKLLIIGGAGYEFRAPANAYGDALDAGIGAAKVLLPDSMQKTMRDIFPEAEFAPSTPSGSFAAQSLAELLDASHWADGVLLPGNIGHNSETTALLENFLDKFESQVTVTGDAADIFCQQPLAIQHRPNTLLVLTMEQLRSLGSAAHFPRAFTSEMGLVQLVDALHEFTKRFEVFIITKHENQLVVATNGQLSTTKTDSENADWQAGAATKASVWWLQNPIKPYESLTTAIYTLR